MNNRKPTLTMPMTLITRANTTCGTLRLNTVTAPVQIASTSAHSSSDPSCAPHTPAMRYTSGRAVLEFCAT